MKTLEKLDALIERMELFSDISDHFTEELRDIRDEIAMVLTNGEEEER